MTDSERSQRLLDLVRRRIKSSTHRWISFADFMTWVLYEPQLGYYCAEQSPIGRDFITVPEMSSLFTQTLALGLLAIRDDNPTLGSQILEVGAGTGALMTGLLANMEQDGRLPEHYFIHEISPSLRQRQQETIERTLPHLREKVVWLEELPESFTGVVLANEVMDAMPIHLVRWVDDALYERGVGVEDDRLCWVDRSLVAGHLQAVACQLPPAREADDYLSEISLSSRAWVRSWGTRLDQGVLLLLDYGYPQAEFYHPQRHEGTLMCHKAHRLASNPLEDLGLQDITSHVDFSALSEAGTNAGLSLYGFVSQGQYLMNCGLLNVLTKIQQVANPFERAQYNAEAQRLLNPVGLGEQFKVLALGKNLREPVCGFATFNRSSHVLQAF